MVLPRPRVLPSASDAELSAALASATTSLRAWVESEPGVWTRPGVAYRVRLTASRRVWAATNPPYQVLGPDGTLLGGSSHLARAQRTAEVLEQPIDVLLAAAVAP